MNKKQQKIVFDTKGLKCSIFVRNLIKKLRHYKIISINNIHSKLIINEHKTVIE